MLVHRQRNEAIGGRSWGRRKSPLRAGFFFYDKLTIATGRGLLNEAFASHSIPELRDGI